MQVRGTSGLVTAQKQSTAPRQLENIFGGDLNGARKTSGNQTDVSNGAGIYGAENAAVGADAGWLIVVLGVERILHFHAQLEGLALSDSRHFA